ncbi:MAG: hypothetical protein V4667_04865 [Bacteroidota bacterium]
MLNKHNFKLVKPMIKKAFFVTALALFFANYVSAQSTTVTAGSGKGSDTQTGDLNCFQRYEKAFKERGAKLIDDGQHDNVVITVRKGNECECLTGKVLIEYGAVIKTYVKMEDGKYEELNKKFKTGLGDIYVFNGISKTRTTIDSELINVVFVDKINPKKANYVKAPDVPKDF